MAVAPSYMSQWWPRGQQRRWMRKCFMDLALVDWFSGFSCWRGRVPAHDAHDVEISWRHVVVDGGALGAVRSPLRVSEFCLPPDELCCRGHGVSSARARRAFVGRALGLRPNPGGGEGAIAA